MAFVVMTSSQKEELLSNAEFAKQVKWAILDASDFWSNDNGSAPAGGLERWRKVKGLAKIVLDGPSIADNQDNIIKFLEYMKNDTCVDNSINPYVAQNTINTLLSTSRFAASAEKWFDSQVAKTL